MTSKGAKENFATKLGFKSSSSSSKAEAEMDKVRKENAHLRRKIDEIARRHVKPPDSDKSKLLERILSLETLRERNNQQLLVKEQELETMRQQLTAKGGEVVASLQAQLEHRRKEAEQRDMLFQNLSQETENLKNQLATVSARCQTMETQVVNGQVPPPDMALVQDQLKDALEKNQQWLVYDQQREAYVQSVLSRTKELEQQLAEATQKHQTKQEACSDGGKSGSEKDAQLKSHYDQLLSGVQKELQSQKDLVTKTQQELNMQREQTLNAQAELQSQKEQVSRLQGETCRLQRKFEDKCGELSSFLERYSEKNKDLDEAKRLLQAERLSNRHEACEERKVSSDRADRMIAELEGMDIRLEEERKRSAELLMQVNMLQKSLLSQNDDQRRIAALEQQIQLSAKDFENEKIDRQSMQHQLHKVLKELRKARDQIAKLESAKQTNARFSEPSSYHNLEFDRLTIDVSPGPTSPSSRITNLLDESFLECPKCRAHYPTSRHRELLAHIDFCLA
ncbi:centrosomal protein of 55 kDa isoform X2 [Notolabrus celidotus]|uniref:centrosomal protein of 55 kDa isoform X2 n=1 Tax=Notolabrus celidotus TaxID=1203425 RepID=UPI00148FBFB3|nr:centrosomal protein of 55 kDa isoform X2 [Notolabrus celidotus]